MWKLKNEVIDIYSDVDKFLPKKTWHNINESNETSVDPWSDSMQA